MEPKLYSIEDLVPILKLHPKTILRFIHEGKIVARKIGRAWMVDQADLKNYVHGELAGRADRRIASNERPPAERISVSAVVELEALEAEGSTRISNSFMAALNGVDDSWGPCRFDFFYYPEVLKAKFVLYGSIKFVTTALTMFEVLGGPKEGLHGNAGL